MSRSALIGAAAVAIACGTTAPPDDGGTDAATDAAQKDTGFDGPVAAYGGPPIDGGVDAQPDSPVAAYGGPPIDGGNG